MMGYHYLALVETNATDFSPRVTEDQAARLRALGLHACHTAGQLTLFVSPETPVLTVPGGVVIGHLFNKDGIPATPNSIPIASRPDQFAKHLLTHYWGEYLLIQSISNPALGIDVLREPSGGVACLYAFKNGTGFITSDIELASGIGVYRQEIDWDFIAQALAYPHIKTVCTGLVGIKELLPGNSLLLRGPSTKIRDDWSPWTFTVAPHRHHIPREAAAEIQSTVASVIRTWAKMDKRILMELSGGLDSSIVASCLHGTDAQVTCYTMVTPVPGADERQYAKLVTDALGLELHDKELGFDNARIDIAPPSHTATPRMGVLQHVSNEIMETAALHHGANSYFSGGGGDSVFCYSRTAVPAADAFREQGVTAGFAAIRDLSTLHQCTHWKAGRLALKKLLRGPKTTHKANYSFLAPSLVISAPEPHPWNIAPAGALPGDRERIADLASTQVFRDSAPRGRERWLRLPLLSQPVMEACLKVPTWMWIGGGENRAIARIAFADQLPRGVLNRRSKGTFINYLGTVYQQQKAQMREYLLTGHLHEHRMLDTQSLEEFFTTTLPPRDTSFTRVFDLCMIENWVRHHG